MNDVLPKPFTKEGLLSMLEKHLQHLKKQAGGGLEVMPPPLNSAQRSLKAEDSPATSPAAVSNWNSPNQLTGGSPGGSLTADEPYMQAGSYVQPGMQAQQARYTSAAPGALAMPPRQQPPPQAGMHRRNISDITGGPEMAGDAKRQQMYGPPNPLAHLQQPMRPPPR